jgi:hypothetical protein
MAFTYWVAALRTRQHLCCPRHAALLVLAGMSLPRPRALPDAPIMALASAYYYRF